MSFLDDYYRDTWDRKTRDDLKLAIEAVSGKRIAIDCGCGAGSDIEFLLSHNFEVHAFDIEKKAIDLCKNRFGNNANLHLKQSSFAAYKYAPNFLTVADASLFFCNEQNFEDIWNSISNALLPSGIFCGSFLGPKDRMHREKSAEQQQWKSTLPLSEQEVRLLFNHYDILSFNEHELTSESINRRPHFWHIFSVVARKTE